jgi:hypothetical protein
MFRLYPPIFFFFLPWINILERVFWIYFALEKNFGMHFLNFFQIWTRKTSENTFWSFYTMAKMKKWRVEKKHGVWEEKNPCLLLFMW